VWIDGAIVAGFVPAEYGVMLRWLTGSVIAGNSARPNDDIERVTGRPARRFEDFVRRTAAAWAPASPKVHGTIIATGARYDNRFCSIITLEDRKIARWRDYMDSHAAWKAMTAAA